MTDAETEQFHHQAHGQTTMKLGGVLGVYTCRTTNSKSCTVGITDKGAGGISVTLSLDAAAARQLAQVLLAAAEVAERVDAEACEVAP
ncbi:hypothetical protein [Acidovorax sp. sic0104]|uniref:hypothetical protein n=1 Tax=Acidovorax sp. sic0104 TaxID=2854784 RepID=UPI001C44B88C|nr:hypothetical protein [Acidovorax sp. sic0104]MBV7542832.1 hypothetical protein [Acidovorax sp. sic0104]